MDNSIYKISKLLFFLLIVGLVGWSGRDDEYENRWVGHTILDAPFKSTCLVKVIEADSKDLAELKFDIYIEEQEKILGAKQRDKSAYAIAQLKAGIKIEHELKGFKP